MVNKFESAPVCKAGVIGSGSSNGFLLVGIPHVRAVAQVQPVASSPLLMCHCTHCSLVASVFPVLTPL